MAKIQNANVTNKELYNKIDMNSIVVAGHSMGATCSIMAGAKLAADDAVVDKSAIKLVITQHPTLPLGQKAPLMVFMHGITAQIEMYLPNLMNYASNGFVVVFPYIKGPKADRLLINIRNCSSSPFIAAFYTNSDDAALDAAEQAEDRVCCGRSISMLSVFGMFFAVAFIWFIVPNYFIPSTQIICLC